MANAAGNGVKWFGGVMAVIAVLGTMIGALVSVTRPMEQRLSQMETAQAISDARWSAKADKYDAWIGEHDRRIEARDASQWERIKSLEREAFGEAGIITIAPGEEP